MNSRLTRLTRIAAAAAFAAAPALGIFAVRFAERRTGPAAASAAAPSVASDAVDVQLQTDKASGYLALAEASVAAGFGADPFERIDLAAGTPDEPEAEDEPQAEPPPEFTVTSVAGVGTTAFAVVNGRLFRVGGEVVQGWRIESIDPATGTVHLLCEDGRTSDASLPRPADRDGNSPRPRR